jgi:hypothetical protein
LLLLLLVTAASVAGVACTRRPLTDIEPFRAAVARAIKLVNSEYPLRARHLEQLAGLAEVATSGERATPWWEGSVGRTESAWLRAVREASETCAEYRASRDRLLRAATGLLKPTRDEVARARNEFRETGMERREAISMQRAEVNLAIAERMLQIGRFQQANENLAQARRDALVVHQGWSAVHARFSDPALLHTWRNWAASTIDQSRRSSTPAIIVDKLRRQVTLYRSGRLAARFRAELGANGLRRKEHAGDSATPEGLYRVVVRKDGNETHYYKALLINYPNDEDRMRFALAKRRGTIPQRAMIGNLIEIHGEGGQGRDWTAGCVALANDDMDALYAAVGVGTPVTIVGTYVD